MDLSKLIQRTSFSGGVLTSLLFLSLTSPGCLIFAVYLPAFFQSTDIARLLLASAGVSLPLFAVNYLLLHFVMVMPTGVPLPIGSDESPSARRFIKWAVYSRRANITAFAVVATLVPLYTGLAGHFLLFLPKTTRAFVAVAAVAEGLFALSVLLAIKRGRAWLWIGATQRPVD